MGCSSITLLILLRISHCSLSVAFFLWLIHPEMNCYITPFSLHRHLFPILSSLLSQSSGVDGTRKCTACTAAHAHSFKHSVRVSRGPDCKQRSSCGCLLCIDFFPIYQRLYPSGERCERDGLWSVHICGPTEEEEEAFSDVSARCTVFMGLHYNPFATVLFFLST